MSCTCSPLRSTTTGRQQHQPRAFGQLEHVIDHLADRLRLERDVVIGAAWRAGAREQQAQVVVDFGYRADRRARVVRRRFLLDGDRGRQPVDMIDIGFFHHRQELPGIGGQRFDVAALAFGVDRVECERRFAGTGQPGNHDQLFARQAQVDVAQVVGPRAANVDGLHIDGIQGLANNLLIYAAAHPRRKGSCD